MKGLESSRGTGGKSGVKRRDDVADVFLLEVCWVCLCIKNIMPTRIC